MICKSCGTKAADDMRFCIKCGQQLVQEDAEVREEIKTETNSVDTVPAVQSETVENKSDIKRFLKNKNVLAIGGMVVCFYVILASFLGIVSAVVNGSEEKKPEAIEAAEETEEIVEEYQMTDFSKGISVGDVVTFGRYEQDSNTNNGTEPVEWDVIAEENGRYLLLSHYVLDFLPFDNGMADDTLAANQSEEAAYCTWAKSTLRTWLNGEFYGGTFTEEEQEFICTVNNTTADWHEFDTGYMNIEAQDGVYGGKGGADTVDQVFLLSAEELLRYFEVYNTQIYKSVVPAAMAAPTMYAIDKANTFISPEQYSSNRFYYSFDSLTNGLLDIDETGYDRNETLWNDYFYGNVHQDYIDYRYFASWILRSPGCWEDAPSCLEICPSIINNFFTCETNALEKLSYGVRPAVWIECN